MTFRGMDANGEVDTDAYANSEFRRSLGLPYLVDLGVILASACSGGSSVDLQPLIGASVGDVMQLVVVNADFVQHDSDDVIHVYPYNYPGYAGIGWSPSDTDPGSILTGAQNSLYSPMPPYVEDGAPLLMSGIGSLATVGAIHLKTVVIVAP